MPPKKKDEDELDLKSLLGLDVSSKKKTKKELSEDQKQVLRDRLIVMRETARIKREEKKQNLEETKSSDNIVIKKTSDDDIDSIFEKKYKDKFEMLTEKLNMISNDVGDIKKMKLQKAEAKRHASELKKQQDSDEQKQKDLEESQRKEALEKISHTKSEPAQEPAKPILTNDQTINEPVGKLSFRQRFKNAKY